MKRTSKIVLYCLFTVLYALLFSLFLECFIEALPFGFSVPMDRHPRLAAFCFVSVFLAVVGIALLVFFSVKYSDKLCFNKQVFALQSFCAVVFSFPLIELWKCFFRFLEKTF